jgi:hypothetical protein
MKSKKSGLTDVFGILALLCLIPGLVLATGSGQGKLARIVLLGVLVFILAWAFAAKYSNS